MLNDYIFPNKVIKKSTEGIKMTLMNTLNMSTFALMNQIVSNIVLLRKKFGFSQSEIAGEYGIDRNGVSRLERGERKVEAELLVYLSEKFKMSIDEIVNYHQIEDNRNEGLINKPINEFSNKFEENEFLKSERERLLNDRKYHEELLKSNQSLIRSLEEQNKGLKEELKDIRLNRS